MATHELTQRDLLSPIVAYIPHLLINMLQDCSDLSYKVAATCLRCLCSVNQALHLGQRNHIKACFTISGHEVFES